MANNEGQTPKRDVGKIINIIAYVGIIIVAITLVLSKIFNSNSALLTALGLISKIIAFAVTAFAAFYFVKSQKNIWIIISYIIAVILIVVFMII